jgi:hypothetical protein
MERQRSYYHGRTVACGKEAATGLPDCRLIVNKGTAGPFTGKNHLETCLHHRDGQRPSQDMSGIGTNDTGWQLGNVTVVPQ